MIRPSVFSYWHLGKLGSILSQRLVIEGYCLDDYVSKGWLPGSCEKTFLGYKIDKLLEEELHLKGVKKEFIIASFLK